MRAGICPTRSCNASAFTANYTHAGVHVAARPSCSGRRAHLSLSQRHRLTAPAAAPETASAAQAGEEKTFLDELRAYAMKLHTREQAPREGKAEAPKPAQAWTPTKEGYLRFLVESREVYAAFEEIMNAAEVPYYSEFVSTGLERVAALDADIAHMTAHWGLQRPVAAPDGPGASYAAKLRAMASASPPAYMCHFYNYYFAHTAGGRMIGAQVSKAALDGWTGDFYKWEGNVKDLLEAVRGKLNAVAGGWSREEKDACLEETPATFKASGELLKLIAALQH